MPIRIDTHQTANVGRLFISEGAAIVRIGQRLAAAAARLDWESRARTGMDGDFAAARPRAEELGQRLIGHGRRLVEIAERFERADADNQGCGIPWGGWPHRPLFQMLDGLPPGIVTTQVQQCSSSA